MSNTIYTCYRCGTVSTPERRVQFVTEWECHRCWKEKLKAAADQIENEQQIKISAGHIITQAPAVLEITGKHNKRWGWLKFWK